jgi:hypothetical protein
MKIRLTLDEVIEACAEFAARKTDYLSSTKDIIDSQYFIIKDQEGKQIDYETVEFEFDAG